MDANAQALIFLICGKTPQHRIARPIAVISVIRIGIERGGQDKVANGLVGHYRRSNPVHIGLPRAEVQLAARSRPDVVPAGVLDIVQKHSGDGSAAAASEGDRRRIGGAAEDGDVVDGVGGAQFDGLAEPRSQRLEV